MKIVNVTGDNGEDLGTGIIGTGDEMTDILIKQIQGVAQGFEQLLVWGQDKDKAFELLKKQAILLMEAGQQIPHSEWPTDDDGTPLFYALMEEEFQKIWSMKGMIEEKAKAEMEAMKSTDVRNFFSGKSDSAVH